MKRCNYVYAILMILILALVSCGDGAGGGGGAPVDPPITYVTGTGTPDKDWYGDGSATAYTIATPDELAGLAELVNEGAPGLKLSGTTITLAANLDLSCYGVGSGGDYDENGWAPIGREDWDGIDDDWRFNGIFDGNNKTIIGLSINNTSYGVYCQGLFGLIGTDGIVKNLTLKDVGITSVNSVVGGVAGYNYGTVENCAVGGSVEGNSEVGGVVGENDGGTVEDCHSSASITGNERVGGVVGSNYGTVEKCYAT
ncbi:MAG: hypothetical protein FWG35_07825, partial [Spirochaetaceae bacterium]|nr:hypothetical protein [Spirochaetaceae bacterium]